MPRYSVTPAARGLTTDPVVFGGTEGRLEDRILIGRLNEQGSIRPVWMDISGESVIAIFGKRGSGKSYTLGVIAEGLAASAGQTSISHSSQHRAVLLLDTLNVFWSLRYPFTS